MPSSPPPTKYFIIKFVATKPIVNKFVVTEDCVIMFVVTKDFISRQAQGRLSLV